MRIAQFELTSGRNTPIPDQGNWRNVRHYDIEGVAFKVGEYYGDGLSIDDYLGEWPVPPAPVYRTNITEGELVELMGQGPYTRAFVGAYPPGASPSDDTALFFFERAKRPTSDDGCIDVLGADATAAFDHFINKGYMIDNDKIRIQKGIEE